MMAQKPAVQSLPSMTNAGARRDAMNTEYQAGWQEGFAGKMVNIQQSAIYKQGWEAGRAARRLDKGISIRRQAKHKPRLWEKGEIEAELKRRQEADQARIDRWRASALRAELVSA